MNFLSKIFKISFDQKRILNIFLIFFIFIDLLFIISFVFFPILNQNLFLAVIISFCIFIICFYLNFKERYLISSGLFLITFSTVFYTVCILNFLGLNAPYEANDVNILVYLIFPVLISVILLPKFWTLTVTLANGAGMLFLTFTINSQLFTNVLIGPFLLYSSISLFSIIAAYYRADIEKKKRYEIIKNKMEVESVNRELSVTRDQLKTMNIHLEEIVAKRTKEIKELIKQKNDFIHLLSHDLKNPLTPMNTLLPIINEKVTDDEIKNMVQMLIKNVNKMKYLINETLKVARLDYLGKDLNIQSVNLHEIVTNILTENSVFLKQNDTEVNCKIDNNINVLVDKMQIEEILNNFLTNSVKYCPMNKKCNININANQHGGSNVEVSFSDNGIGLSSDQIKHIFEEFYKGAKPREGMDSTGLGLSICKNIIKNHKGRIWVESEGIGKGSTFYFTLPLYNEQQTEKSNNKIDSYLNLTNKIDNLLT